MSLALAATALIAASCTPAPPSVSTARGTHAARYFGATTPPSDGAFRFDLSTDPETIDPALATGQPDGRVVHILFEGLTREDPRTLEPLPGQAARWEVSRDGLTYTFHLRPGLTWSDGTPIRAEDFRWSWVRVLNAETTSRSSGLLSPILNAEAFAKGKLQDERRLGLAAPDDSTFVVTLRAPTPYFLSLTSYNAFMPTPRRVIEAHGDRWTMPGNLVGNGAFRLRHWRQGERFVFDRNPRYWDAASVRLGTIIAYTADAIGSSTNLYKAGMIDWNPSGNMPSPFLPYLRAFSDYRQGPFQGLYFYSMNCTRKPFDNVWVRRALAWAVDRDAIADDLLKGTLDGRGNFTPTGYPSYRAPDPIRFDPSYARDCLARAGFPGGKGFPKIEILFRTSDDLRRIAEAVQAMWKRELGIRVELSNAEWGTYMKNTTGLQYDVASRSWIADYLDPNTFLACYVSGDGNNRTGWSNARYDRLIQDAAFEPDTAKRMALLREAETLLLSECPVIPIYQYTTSELVKPYVRGLYSTPLDSHPLTHVWIDPEWRRHADADSPTAAGAAPRRGLARGDGGGR
jgi:oligopeptide transport system substrate-binding protein